MVRQAVRHWRNRKQSGCWRERDCVCVCYLAALNLDRKPSFLCSDQARLKIGLLSYACCSVISQSFSLMIQIYRFTKCVCFYLYLWNQVISLTSSVTPTALLFLISNFRRVLNVVCFLLGDFPVSEFYMATFRNTVCSIFIGG